MNSATTVRGKRNKPWLHAMNNPIGSVQRLLHGLWQAPHRVLRCCTIVLFSCAPSLALPCGSYQTCNDLFILNFDAAPQYRAEGDPVHVSLHSFEFANWFSSISTMTYPPIALGNVAQRTIPGSTVQTSNEGPYGYGIFPSYYWFTQNTEWDSTLDWNGLDGNGKEVTEPTLFTATLYAGAATASRAVALFVTSGKNLGKPECPQGNPCNPATGNKYQEQVDVVGSELRPRFIRYYNHMAGADLGLGNGWSSNYKKRLRLDASPNKLSVINADGRRERLTASGGVWLADADSHLKLVSSGTGFTLTLDTGAVETYSAAGRLLSDSDSAGRITNYAYDSAGHLIRVTAPFGHTLSFVYNVGGHLETLTDDNQKVVRYSYDAYNNLRQADYPDLTAKKYFYEDVNNPHNLTGLAYINSAGVELRFATFSYDANSGKAIFTQHATTTNGAPQEKFSFSYDSDTQTTVKEYRKRFCA